MTRDALKSLLQSNYKRERWLVLLHDLLPTTQAFGAAKDLSLDDASIASASQIARIPLAGDRTVAVLEVRVTGQVDLQRNRVGLRNLVSRFIGQEGADAVLAFFVGDAPDYRFSFAARTNRFTADGQLEQNETAPRRYTYLFGPGLPCRTALERLELLRSLGARAQLSDLIEAFKVEPLFKEFYRDYGRVFEAVENHVRPSLSEKERLRLFTQRLFNRLMFLAFVERKGWLRLGQRSDYLAALWNDYKARLRTSPASVNFYADRLVPIFFEVLNQPDRPADSVDQRIGFVPYLNGGLCEYAEDGTDRLPALRVPDEAIALILDSETGLFSRYNFTVAESTPLEIQVAVDPEMLGKVFEELVTGRHEQGSYYTPKPIVAFMARAALVEHLADRCRAESREAVEKFVHDDDASALRDPEAVHRALLTIKVCDPACGSGAYLLGMLHELLDLRTRIFASRQKPDPENAYQRRLQIIERNLYGVDKDAFAVNIARLRLWLALAVEFEGPVPPPLPNLDFKIEVGDALAAPAPQDIFQRPAVEEFRDKKAAFLRAHGEEKARLKAELEHIRADLALWQQADLSDHGFNWAVEFAEVFLPDAEERALLGELLAQEDASSAIQSGGFDIIVANPPYVRQELIKEQKPVLKKRFPEVFTGVADLYVYFFARAHELLRPGGVAAFISSNKWLRAGYGESLRQYLLDGHAFHLVMDFGELGVFDTAATDAAIFIWQKLPRIASPTAWAMVKDLNLCYSQGVRHHFQLLRIDVPANQFGKGNARLASIAAAGLRKRMESRATLLRNYIGGEIKWGLKTGLNEAFVVDRLKRKQLVDETPLADEIIRPILAGDDVRRYETHFRETYIILTKIGVPIHRYTSVLRHLEPFEEKARKRTDQGQHWWELRACVYYEEFLKPKIVYPEIGKEARFVLETEGRYLNNKCFFLPSADWFLLAVLNSASVFAYLKEVCATLGDKDDGGRLEYRAQYLRSLIPDASLLTATTSVDSPSRRSPCTVSAAPAASSSFARLGLIRPTAPRAIPWNSRGHSRPTTTPNAPASCTAARLT
ncbi:MAG: Eco57I restriction-modification methylase domain-containing protein [Opitutaceae bacterium]|nr:Eco57I restriction-modification methylase domain-containing protein [Opitutaceae bacterium]